MVQNHAVRRSFATNEYKRGTKTAIIMAITGHKTERDFWTYIRLTQQKKQRAYSRTTRTGSSNFLLHRIQIEHQNLFWVLRIRVQQQF